MHDRGCPGRRGGICECALRYALVVTGIAVVIVVILAVMLGGR
jgi:hypothetical protein